ncbi:MAG TPA: (E)-4-hydroxy-3-methylbut-2-enyl-diphosphate synthase [Fibrobacteria bacterium]|nr:(E)-4-hydroxy-3-methylbut-2-enyl-diphosphate synthase [Fibrobacteria bacterium]
MQPADPTLSAPSSPVPLSYVADRFAPKRRRTLPVRVGNRIIGGDAPILVQSMTTTNTKDVDATVFQTLELAKAGCELVRITAPTQKDAEALQDIVAKVRAAGCDVPISADIHFQPRAAMEAVKWVDKVRINPGNFVDSKSPTTRLFDEASFESGVQKVYDAFAPLVRLAKDRGVALRIGTNHGSLSDRIMWKYGDTIEGMVESALEYVRVCEAEDFDQVVFSMKSSNPRVVVEAYRLLAARLDRDHKPYPFHVGVTEAGDGEDGRLKSSVGIGALLFDGLGDTLRVSLTEDPVHEIPVAKALVGLCDTTRLEAVPRIQESIDYYAFQRRDVLASRLGGLAVGGREKLAVGIADPGPETLPKGDRRVEWLTTRDSHVTRPELPTLWHPHDVEFALATRHPMVSLASSHVLGGKSDLPTHLEIQVEDPAHLDRLPPEVFEQPQLLWSCALSAAPDWNPVARYRHLAAWLARKGRKDAIILRDGTDGSPEANMLLAARFGSLLVDGIGDLVHVEGRASAEGGASARVCMHLAYDILQAAGVRKTKPEYVACPSCGRTLFDLQTTTQKIRARTAHLKNISIAIMGCIVNGPGEMADADFGYVGGAPSKVNLYVGRDCVRKNIPEEEAPEALVQLIKAHGRWVEPAPEASA